MLRHHFKIKDGKPVSKFSDVVVNHISGLKDGYYTLSIATAKSAKTIAQNAYFHGVIVKIFSDETGFSTKDCKRYLKNEFGAREIVTNPLTGKEDMDMKSVAAYSIEEMSELIDASVQFLRHNLGYVIPDPGDAKVQK